MTARDLATLERVVRDQAARAGIGSPASTELLASLDAVTSTRRARVAESSREIPALYVLTLVAAGMALLFNAGALTVRSGLRTAVLAGGLACVVGLSLALLFSITAPWRGPLVVSGSPVDVVISDLESGFFDEVAGPTATRAPPLSGPRCATPAPPRAMKPIVRTCCRQLKSPICRDSGQEDHCLRPLSRRPGC